MGTTLELSELDAKIGQLFMVGIPGYELDEETRSLIRRYNIGGVILFSRNIKDPVQLAYLTMDIQQEAIETNKIPLFIAVDQEGGKVARLKEPFTQFPGNSAIGASENPLDEADRFAKITAKELRLVGINMNLAPVLDVKTGELERHLSGRIFGEDPRVVSKLGRAVIRTLQENGIMAVAKHFPGLGQARVDPHQDLPVIDIQPEEIEKNNLAPFKEAIAQGVCGIMTSHAVYKVLDPAQPATMSRAIVTGLLREKMGFQGLVITDDLEMGAVRRHKAVPQGAAAAFEAGADILLICKDQTLFLESLRLMRSNILKGTLPLTRLQQANDRIARAKSRFLGQAEKISVQEVKSYFKQIGS
ncbi:MAG: beta-N-acetylhexosaminidase [Deltaproteobacteria bacterium]|nr:beta-N-acetylhexosaminidase [Deltaproteobacteria bacterium]